METTAFCLLISIYFIQLFIRHKRNDTSLGSGKVCLFLEPAVAEVVSNIEDRHREPETQVQLLCL